MRRPLTSTLQRLAALMPGMTSRLDPEEAAAYEEASMAAFRAAVREAGAGLEGTSPREPALTATPIAQLFPRPESVLPSDRARPVASVPVPNAPNAVRAASSEAREPAFDDPPDQRHHPLTDPSEGDMRPSSSVAKVADDFFDSLIRRVEGDR